jgi:hypothetical protein
MLRRMVGCHALFAQITSSPCARTKVRMHEINDSLHGEWGGLRRWVADEAAAFALVER